jgi:alkylated DNA repair dioxygenase AlkB
MFYMLFLGFVCSFYQHLVCILSTQKCKPKYHTIGSVSFGATRVFQFKHKNQPELKEKINLEDGSFLLMQGTTQHNWLHQIPKTAKILKPRINLTFRIL